jgi:hypothetical protein
MHSGGSLEPLLVGKLALKHIPLIESLLARNILKEPSIKPRYWKSDLAKEKLTQFRNFSDPAEIITELNQSN